MAQRTFGRSFRSRRLALGLTQAQVAEAAETTVETISRIETGGVNDVGLKLASRLAVAVSATLDALLSDQSPKPSDPTLRPAEGRIIALLATLDDHELDDVYFGLRRLLGVRAKRTAK